MSTARKAVIVRKLTRDWCVGYTTAEISSDLPELELLDTSGKLMRIEWSQVKWVCYVRELRHGGTNGNEKEGPERLLRRRFNQKPRIAGVWLKIAFQDGEELEGVASNDVSLLSGGGLSLIPPDTRSNTQRVFVPRSAIHELTVMGVIAPGTAKSGSVRMRRQTGLQSELFEQATIEE